MNSNTLAEKMSTGCDLQRERSCYIKMMLSGYLLLSSLVLLAMLLMFCTKDKIVGFCELAGAIFVSFLLYAHHKEKLPGNKTHTYRDFVIATQNMDTLCNIGSAVFVVGIVLLLYFNR